MSDTVNAVIEKDDNGYYACCGLRYLDEPSPGSGRVGHR
jgi:hypothetical protein